MKKLKEEQINVNLTLLADKTGFMNKKSSNYCLVKLFCNQNL